MNGVSGSARTTFFKPGRPVRSVSQCLVQAPDIGSLEIPQVTTCKELGLFSKGRQRGWQPANCQGS